MHTSAVGAFARHEAILHVICMIMMICTLRKTFTILACEATIPPISIEEGPFPMQRTTLSLYSSGVRKSWLCSTDPLTFSSPGTSVPRGIVSFLKKSKLHNVYITSQSNFFPPVGHWLHWAVIYTRCHRSPNFKPVAVTVTFQGCDVANLSNHHI